MSFIPNTIKKIFGDRRTFNFHKEKFRYQISMATSLKKKYTQNDLRRLMAEQKAKSAPKTTTTTTTTINSPLAKYPFQICLL